MAKARKGLLISLFTLLVAIVVTTSATYAWFAMNDSVTATGMQVTAKSNNTFLLIGTGENDTAAEIQTAGLLTVALTVSDNDAKLLPCAPVTNVTEAGYLTTEGKTVGGATITTAGAQVTNAATADAVTNWYTANAAAANASAISATTARQLTSFTGYVIKKTVYLTVEAGANAANNLRVIPTITQKTGGEDVSACKMIITTSNGGFVMITSANSGNEVTITGAGNITDAAAVTVNIYIYYDGNDSNVYTNNAADLTGADIDLAFKVDAVVAA